MSTFLKKFYFVNNKFLNLSPQDANGLVFFSDRELSLFFEKFANILGFSGRKRQFWGLFREVFFLLRLNFRLDVRQYFKKILSDYVVLIGIKPVRKRSIIVKELRFLQCDQAFGLFSRWLKSAINIRAERTLAEKIYNEFVDINSGIGSTLRRRNEYVIKVLEIKKQLYI